MAKSRKDPRGRMLRKGESWRESDQRYTYTYTDPLGRRKWLYAPDLVILREKEKQLMKDQLDGLNLYAAGKATVNNTFDRYIANKYDLRDSTRSNYLYTYNKFVRDTFGKKRLVDVKFSDVLQFYLHLINVDGLALGTLDNVHCVLHPTFELAVRDDIIRKNPTTGVKKEISKKSGKNRGIRKALTTEQQRIFMEYIAGHPIFYHWWPLFTVLLGTGCRIGEAISLRWDDLDFENRVISVNHGIVYYRSSDRKQQLMRISLPKTEAGIRTIPMLDVVKTAFEMEREQQMDAYGGLNEQVIDGMTGFVFQNSEGRVPNPQTVNQAIRRITEHYNDEELLKAAKEKREPVLLPHFSCHHLRHTFATRLCEAESNLKVIQSVMGHRNIETTMDIYAEATDEKKQESFEGLALKLSNLF